MICQRCEHTEADHCKGGVEHFDHKEESRMMRLQDRRKKTPCAVRHCLQPLCSCVDFAQTCGAELDAVTDERGSALN